MCHELAKYAVQCEVDLQSLCTIKLVLYRFRCHRLLDYNTVSAKLDPRE